MRRKIVAGNWKMNLSFSQADDLINEIIDKLEDMELEEDKRVIICPPFPYLELLSDSTVDTQIDNGAQNVSAYNNGAYTGEISSEMLSELEIDYCIIGHSERRKYFNESNKEISEKLQRLLEKEITPILCVGESLEERESGKHFDVVKTQIEESLLVHPMENIDDVIIAYEPVWAIGTGKTATSEQAQEMHAFIRSLLREKHGEEFADGISILYGGSCNAKNAKELFSNPDVDGGLIGGAALKADDFIAIIKSL
ncbi:MAG: triose-phosphate isomerase [Bacteroidales bacterium]|jgi:triosephosphate isomerase|nr:triose-phosphate isomerase [Bacteroidales bacterium]MDD4544913.1 triose-phosphate isomerase [Bacteroidales bacterium]MDY0053507.1 triose-phosphate isomerase [Bacteroidales bacterium]